MSLQVWHLIIKNKNQLLIDLLSQFKDELKKDTSTQCYLIVSEFKDSLSSMSNKMDSLNRKVFNSTEKIAKEI